MYHSIISLTIMRNALVIFGLLILTLTRDVAAQCFFDAECTGASDVCTTTPRCVNGRCASACEASGPNFCDSGAGVCNTVSPQCEYSTRHCLADPCFTVTGGCDRSLNDGTGGCPPQEPKVCEADGNICTQEACNASTNACEYIPYIPAVCENSDMCIHSDCDVANGGCVFTPVVCEDDGDVCTRNACKNGDCVVADTFIVVSFPNATVYDCVEQELNVGAAAELLRDKDHVLALYGTEQDCVRVVTDETGATGLWFTCDTPVTITMNLFNPKTITLASTSSTDLVISSASVILEEDASVVIDDAGITTDPYPSGSFDPVVTGCDDPTSTSCVTLEGSWNGVSVTSSTESSCVPDYETALANLVMFGYTCDTQSAKRSVAQTETFTGEFTGNVRVTLQFPAAPTPVFYKNLTVILRVDAEPEPDDAACSRSRCYWTENHGTCTSVEDEARFPSVICGIDTQSIFDADISGDAWPLLAIETLTARDNCLCANISCTSEDIELIEKAYALLESNCHATPVRPANVAGFGKFVSLTVRLRKITRTKLCLDEFEEEYRFCTPSIRKVSACKDPRHQPTNQRPVLSLDCNLEPVTSSGHGYYQNMAAYSLNEPLQNPSLSSSGYVPVFNMTLLIAIYLCIFS